MLRLCSSSLSRKRILEVHNIPFIQCDNNFNEESILIKEPKKFAYHAVLGKHRNALRLYGLDLPLLVVDTVIDYQNTLQRKAKDVKEAELFLQNQSGDSINILTCMIVHTKDFYLLDMSQTHYEFFEFDSHDLQSYLDSCEWQNKAGAVMMEGFHQKYIKKQIGTTSNAMGLNVEVLQGFLKRIL